MSHLAGLRLVVLALAASAPLACAGRVRHPPEGAERSPGPTSNILRGDYAGSQSCAPCHPAVYAAWQTSPMHNMTRLPGSAVVRAPFDGSEYRYKADRARFERRGSERYVDVRSPEFGDHLYRVTKIIGGRYREDFAGVEVTGSGAGERPVGNPTQELILPVSYVFETSSFRLKGYSVMVGERPGLRAGGVWNQTCVLCHNTAPLFDSLWGALHGPGAPSYQGVVVDRLLPRERRSSLAVTDPGALASALRDEMARLSGGTAVASAAGSSAPRPLLAEAARTLRERLVPDQLVEVGIGCEACHGGSRSHLRRNEVLPSFEPRAPFLEARPADGQATVTRAERINRACARCHQVLFSRYPYTWEGGLRGHDPGGSHITSGEARDFLLGGCARRMSCVTCHDPHGAEDRSKLQALATPAGNRVCVDCHPRYASTEAVRAHAHHDPAGAGGACLACHMPRKNLGLGYQLTRYHRIGSPTDRARVEGDRPLECALCHPDARVDELVGTMERWWGGHHDRERLRALYGDLAAPVLAATIARGKPHEQATAIAVMGEAHLAGATAPLAAALSHPYPLVRYYARRALEQVRGAPVPIDLEQSASDIRMAVARWLDPNGPLPPRLPDPPRAFPVDSEEN
jgi:predicted CXXCH cytochrome family protein